MKAKYNLLGMYISLPERLGLEAGAMFFIKRPMEHKPDPEIMEHIKEFCPELKLYTETGKLHFAIPNPAFKPGNKEPKKLLPRYTPKHIIWCHYAYRSRKGNDQKGKWVNRNSNGDTIQRTTTMFDTAIYLKVTQVMLIKSKGKWHWMYQVKRIEKPKFLTKNHEK